MFKITTNEKWLKKAAELEGDYEISAGPEIDRILPVSAQIGGEEAVEADSRLRAAFSVFMHKMRMSRNLTIEELAKKTEVDEDQLRCIEKSVGFKAPPRTLVQLSNFYEIPPAVILQMSGALKRVDKRLEEDVVSFAAKSESFEKLTQEEKRLLNEFVKVLQDYNQKKLWTSKPG